MSAWVPNASSSSPGHSIRRNCQGLYQSTCVNDKHHTQLSTSVVFGATEWGHTVYCTNLTQTVDYQSDTDCRLAGEAVRGSRQCCDPYKATMGKDSDETITTYSCDPTTCLTLVSLVKLLFGVFFWKGHLDLMKMWLCKHFSNVSHVPLSFRFLPFLFDVVTQYVSRI